MAIDFQDAFNAWLDSTLSGPVPDEVIAYQFNLTEPWSLEVVGCGSFDADDPDWACDEVFRPDLKSLLLPVEHVGNDWEAVLQASVGMVTRYLDRASEGSRRLRASEGVGIGFVDGDLTLLWPRLGGS